MSKVAAINWNPVTETLSYIIVDRDTCTVLDGPTMTKNITTQAQAVQFVNQFCAALTTHTSGGEVEHHIANPSTTPAPSALSLFIRKQLEMMLQGLSNWKLVDAMVQGMTEGDDRRKFKEGLKDLGFWSGKQGTTYEIDLWTIAIHQRNPKKCLAVLWRISNGLVARWTKSDRERFADWYEDLAA